MKNIKNKNIPMNYYFLLKIIAAYNITYFLIIYLCIIAKDNVILAMLSMVYSIIS